METSQNIKVNIEKRYNKWVYIGALYLSYIAGAYLQSEMTIYGVIDNFSMLLSTIQQQAPYSTVIFLRLLIPLLHVGLFELFSRIFYALCNTFSFGAVSMSSKDFVSCLRIFVILANIALGILNLLYYFYNFLIPIGFMVLSFAITTGAYFMFFMYINKHYLDKKTAHRAFRIMAIFYLSISFFNIVGGLIL
jgi:hypothetical protein